MAEEKNKRLCVMCKKEAPYSKEFDRCMTCARKYRDETYKEVIAILTPEQLVVFQKYHEAEENYTSIMMMD